MNIAESFRIAIEALRANRLRSLLTMLGVIIGVAAVVLLVAIGNGAKQEVEAQVQGLGSNLILVVPGSFEFGSAPSVSRLGLDDVDYVARALGAPGSVAATVSGGEQVRVGSVSQFATINGTNAAVPDVFDRPLSNGRYLTDSDVDTRRRVAIVGAGLADALFGEVDPIGRQLQIAGVRFRVIGEFAPVGSTFGVDRDAEIHIPISAAQRLFGVTRVDALAVKAPTVDSVETVQQQILDALADRYPDDEFSAVTQTQILGTLGTILGLLTLLLAAIAAISLLVGGVGVSNIMLVSVRERTREIGLRMALGARQRDIQRQFLTEAVVLAGLGGLIGIAIGVGGALLIEAVSPLPAAITWWSVALAFGVSLAVGVFFGVFPARRAARMDPVVALRVE